MAKSIALLDGGMGQELIRRSELPPTPIWATRVLLDSPEIVETLHIDFIRAGAKVISLNNYTATPTRLARDASVDLFEPIHKEAIRVAHAAREKSGADNIQISGCLPPLVASYKPDLVPSYEACLEEYRKIAAIQADGVDVLFCETMATIREAEAAAMAANETGLPVVISFTLDDDNPRCLRSGETLIEGVKAVEALGVEAVMVNCSMPETITAALPSLVKAFPKVGAYANGFQSIAGLEAGGTVSELKARRDLTPEKYANYVLEWAAMGAQILGGCCEVGPAHIAAINRALLANNYVVTPI